MLQESGSKNLSTNNNICVSIILPTFNEGENILKMIKEIETNLISYNYEIIIVDDDSPDNTWKIVEEKNNEKIRVIRRIKASGLASAILRGIIESKGDILIWLDSDMQNCPYFFPAMIEKTKEYDLVIGSRYVPGGIDERPEIRIITSKMLNNFAKYFLGYGINDYDSGFIVCKRSIFDRVVFRPYGYGEYCIELIYQCCRNGLKVIEMPYTIKDRTIGISKSSPSFIHFLILGIKYGVSIIMFKVRYLTKR